MANELVSAPNPPSIDGFNASYLPSMEFSPISVLFLAPVLLFIINIALEGCSETGHAKRVEPALFVMIGLGVLSSSLAPVATYLTHLTSGEGLDVATSRIKWLPATVASSLAWSVLISIFILMGSFAHRNVATICAVAISVYYLFFPLSYTGMQGRGLLGPSLREVLIIVAVAVLLNVQRKRLTRLHHLGILLVGASVAMISVAAGTTLYYQATASSVSGWF